MALSAPPLEPPSLCLPDVSALCAYPAYRSEPPPLPPVTRRTTRYTHLQVGICLWGSQSHKMVPGTAGVGNKVYFCTLFTFYTPSTVRISSNGRFFLHSRTFTSQFQSESSPEAKPKVGGPGVSPRAPSVHSLRPAPLGIMGKRKAANVPGTHDSTVYGTGRASLQRSTPTTWQPSPRPSSVPNMPAPLASPTPHAP